MNQPFKKIDSREAYHGKVLNVRVDTVQYRNRNVTWEVVEMGKAVVVMPIVQPDTFLLLHQYRYVTGGYLWEFPAGRAHEEEPLEQCAQRELEEECGYRAQKMVPLITYYPSPGVMTETMHLFAATGLYRANEAQPDDDEIIETVPVDAATIDAMISRGEIIDAKTILAFFYYKLYRDKII